MRRMPKKYGRALVRAPYSQKSLADASDPFFQLQPYKGGWIVVNNGVHVGSVKKSKSGWKMDGYPEADLKRAIALLEAHEVRA